MDSEQQNIVDYVGDYHKYWWQQVYQRVLGGVVFIEDCLAECLHWDGGLFNLVDAGAISVKCLSSFESGDENQKKAVFITRGTSANLNSIQEILLNSHFVSCILITNADSNILSSESDVTYDELKETVGKWMSKKECMVEIVHTPLFGVSITNNIFITPVFSKLYPKFGHGLFPTQTSMLDLHSLLLDDKNEVRRLASSIDSFLEYLGVKEDIFYLGPFSSVLAGVLEHLPSGTRRKNASGQASIVFIDRTLDICGVTTHSSNSVLDKLMTLLPRFPGHSTDLAVDISPLCEADMVTITDDVHLSPGCIVHVDNESNRQNFEYFVNKTQTEVMFGLYSKLMRINNMSPGKFPPRVTAQNLEKLISTYKGNYKIIEANSGLLQQSLGIVQALKSPDVQQIDLLMCLEKQVLQSITTSRDSTSVLSQISHIIKSWKQRGLSLERLLSLLVYIYSLAGGYITFSEAQEKTLHESLSTAIYENKNNITSCFESLDDAIHCKEDADFLTDFIINRLKDLSKLRDNLTRYKSVINVIDKVSPSEYKGVLQQLIGDIVDIRRPDMPDLKCRTAGLKDFLLSGFNILMSTTSKNAQNISKHPFDNPLVIIYVIGGITAEECFKIHRDIMISGTDINVIIGSTSLVNPVEAMKQALFI
ncbi:sec1 family domain-containing protein 2-like [Arctopsyche grandis]|uniref:sec1 family domain-containing protein 2-like n=1 Tax=Arctopsyche grandis TaxID=121162 RepID=UPI00406D9BD5